MNYNNFIEFIGDHADVVAILLAILFFAIATRLLTDFIMKVWGFLKRRNRRDTVSLPLLRKTRNHAAVPEPGNCSKQAQNDLLDKNKPTFSAPQSATRKQSGDVDAYVRQFLSPGQGATIRQGVYVDRELHTKISTIVGIVGKRNVTVGNYVDAVLTDHFSKYEKEAKSVCSEGINKIL